MQPGSTKTLIHCISNESGTSNIFILRYLLMSEEEWLSIGNTDTLKNYITDIISMITYYMDIRKLKIDYTSKISGHRCKI